MGVLADRLAVLIEQMKESDRRHQQLIDEHLKQTRKFLEEAKFYQDMLSE